MSPASISDHDMDHEETDSHNENRVLIIATGGTMCMQPGPDGLQPSAGFLDNAMAPYPSFNDGKPKQKVTAFHLGKSTRLDSLRTPETANGHHVRYAVLEFDPLLDSSSIAATEWALMATAVKENYNLYDGFVIIHGTDTMAYTASALSFMIAQLGKPVILTGSQAPIFKLQSDAPSNLLGSIILATYPIPEVGLFFNNKLYRGNRSTKVSATSLEAFASPNMKPLAEVNGLGIEVNWEIVQRATSAKKVEVQKVLDLNHLLCIRVFPGITLEKLIQGDEVRGLVLQTFGMGNIPGGPQGRLTQVLREAVQNGVIVVNVSQCSNGFASPVYAAGAPLAHFGVIFGHDMSTEAALTKLAYLLGVPGLTHQQRVEKFSHSLRGEMTEHPRSR